MLDPRQYSTSSPFAYFEPLQTYLEQPFPRTPQDFLDMEQQLYKTAAEVGDHLVLMQIEAAHSDRAFVKEAVEAARQRSEVPLVHKGCKTIGVLLLVQRFVSP